MDANTSGRTNDAGSRRLLNELQKQRLELQRQNEELRLARAEVEAGLEKYYQLYDFAPVGYCTVDQEGEVLESNLAGALLLGVDRARLLRRHLKQFVAPESFDQLGTFFSEIYSTRKKATGEILIPNSDGGQRLLYLEGAAFEDQSGGRRGRIAMMDVTESRQNSVELEHYRYHLEELVQQRTSELEMANLQLKEQAENLASIYKALQSIGLIVCSLTQDNAHIDIFSAGAERLFGHRQDTVLGKSLSLICPQEGSGHLLSQMGQWRQGHPMQSMNMTLVRQGGEQFPAVVSIHPFCKVQGEFTKLVGAFRDISELIEVQEQLQDMNDELERRVALRTTELHESNVALTVLLKKREEDRKILGEQVVSNTSHLVEPLLERLRKTNLTAEQRTLVDILATNINEITSPFASNFSSKLNRLTPAELQVANLVKLGKRTKEIAEIMHLSPGTISIHRKNIRRKLELTHQKTNLQTMLSNNS
ncbi:PAS domain S-box protein [Desulfobulbus rhabdoformis]|uniref:PAS domain S-box protein n=1 Tax=Desulfobulbus rhabdoformis TaxID=34032 RepID=UPI0019656CFE|nr:PAS domain S-box protein [Desulfobulbus rhabdoformis]